MRGFQKKTTPTPAHSPKKDVYVVFLQCQTLELSQSKKNNSHKAHVVEA